MGQHPASHVQPLREPAVFTFRRNCQGQVKETTNYLCSLGEKVEGLFPPVASSDRIAVRALLPLWQVSSGAGEPLIFPLDVLTQEAALTMNF